MGNRDVQNEVWSLIGQDFLLKEVQSSWTIARNHTVDGGTYPQLNPLMSWMLKVSINIRYAWDHRDISTCWNTCYMDVSKNRGGPPKSSILIRVSIIDHPFRGTIIFGNNHIDTHLVTIYNHPSKTAFSKRAPNRWRVIEDVNDSPPKKNCAWNVNITPWREENQ